MATHLTANDMPFVLLNRKRLKTYCYNKFEIVAAGAMGNSRKGFGDFTDPVKLPVRWVKSPYSILGRNMVTGASVTGYTLW